MKKHLIDQSSGLHQLAESLGWFSIALGAAEILLPGRLSRAIGIKNRPLLLRLLGARELMAGLGILLQPNTRGRAGWMWSRVAGDAMDLALLGTALAGPKAARQKVALATAAVAGVTALDLVCSGKLTTAAKTGQPFDRNATSPGCKLFRKSIVIGKAPEEVYRFWRNFENLPRFIPQLQSVTLLDQSRSRWVIQSNAGKQLEWTSLVTEDLPNQKIAWKTTGDAEIEHDGTIRFERAPGGRGTLVRVEMEYRAPGGMLGSVIAKFTRDDATQQIHDGLRFLKQIMETGNIVSTRGQSAGRKLSVSKKFDTAIPEPVNA